MFTENPWLKIRKGCNFNDDLHKTVTLWSQVLLRRFSFAPNEIFVDDVTVEEDKPIGSGGFGDVFKAIRISNPSVVKFIRVPSRDNMELWNKRVKVRSNV
jgi:hypothetical protein